MKLILIHGDHGKTTLGGLIDRVYGHRSRLVHLDVYIHKISLADGTHKPSKHLGAYYRANTSKILKIIEEDISEILQPDKEIIIVEGVYTDILRTLSKSVDHDNIIWFHLNTHTNISLNGTKLKCNFTVNHSNNRNVGQLLTELDDININEYFHRLYGEDPYLKEVLLS